MDGHPVSSGRRRVEQFCADAGIDPELTRTAVLLSCELLGIALRSGQSGVALELHLVSDRLHIAVHDSTELQPLAAATAAEPAEELAVVASLSSAWGLDDSSQSGGATVWFELAVSPSGQLLERGQASPSRCASDHQDADLATDTTADAHRMVELRSFAVLDTAPEAAFDALTHLAAEVCQTPMALISLVDADRQWFKAKVGIESCGTEHDVSFCSHAIRAAEPFIVSDASLDARFSDRDIVTGAPWIRFYAGIPLITDAGHALGTLCVLDTAPRQLTERQLSLLTGLAGQVLDQLMLRRQAAELNYEVTTRRWLQAALSAGEQRWEAMVERSPVAVAVISAVDGRFTYCNPRAAKLYGGSSPADIIGTDAADYVPSGEEAAAEALFGRIAIDGDTILGRRWKLRRLDGVERVVEVNAARVKHNDAFAVQVELRDVDQIVTAEQALRQSEARWRELVECSPVGIALVDDHGVFVSANAALCAILGLPSQEVVGKNSFMFTHPDDMPATLGIPAALHESPTGVVRMEKRYVRPGGEHRWVSLTITHFPGLEGQKWTLAHLHDVTESKLAEEATRQSHADLIAVAEVVTQIQRGSDARETIIHAAQRLAGASVVSLIEPSDDRTELLVTASTDPRAVGAALSLKATSVTVETFHSGEAMFISDPDRDPMVSPKLVKLVDCVSFYSVPVRSGDTVTGVLSVGWNHVVANLDDHRARVVRLLADHAGLALRQAALVAELRNMSRTDPLTGLANRRSWDDQLETLMNISKRSGTPLTVAIADLDHFKRYNDTHGHVAGDALLRGFASNTEGALRAGDIVARWGGEEFTIALPDCEGDAASSALTRVRQAVPFAQTCSIGYATWNGAEGADDLMRRADAALYRAKDAGRDRLLADS